MRRFAGSTGRRAAGVLVAGAMVASAWVVTEEPASAHGACRSRAERVSGLTAGAKLRCATAQRVAPPTTPG